MKLDRAITQYWFVKAVEPALASQRAVFEAKVSVDVPM